MNNSTSTHVVSQDVVHSGVEKWQYLEWLQGINNSANIPSFVLLSVLTICGVFGNSLILLVYSRKVNKTPTVILIQVIAFVDLITNVVIIPGTIYTILHTVTYTNVFVCKGYYFLNSFTAWTSAVLLVIVALIRYRKICRPFGRQITTKETRVICACAMGLSLLFSIPFGVLYDLVVSKTGLPDTYSHNCGIADQYSATIWPKLSHGFYVLVVVTCCITLSTLYILIGLAARRHAVRKVEDKTPVELSDSVTKYTLSPKDKLQQRSSTSCDKDESSVGSNTSKYTNANVISANDNKLTMNVQTIKTREHQHPQTVTVVPSFEPTTYVTREETEDTRAVKFQVSASETTNHSIVESITANQPKANNDARASSESSKNYSATSLVKILPTNSPKGRNSHCLLMGKTTRMLLATSVTYIVSYMTTITILLLTAATTLLDHPTAQEDSIINFFIVFYLINSAANPIIYSICNPNFRHDCIVICKQCSIKSCNKYLDHTY